MLLSYVTRSYVAISRILTAISSFDRDSNKLGKYGGKILGLLDVLVRVPSKAKLFSGLF